MPVKRFPDNGGDLKKSVDQHSFISPSQFSGACVGLGENLFQFFAGIALLPQFGEALQMQWAKTSPACQKHAEIIVHQHKIRFYRTDNTRHIPDVLLEFSGQRAEAVIISALQSDDFLISIECISAVAMIEQTLQKDAKLQARYAAKPVSHRLKIISQGNCFFQWIFGIFRLH